MNDVFYLKQAEPNQSCLLALRQIILACNPAVSETKKYGMPCFCFKNKMFCYLWLDSKSDTPYILFVDGNKIDHPSLVAGSRKRMKVLNIDPNQDLELDLIHHLLNQAISLIKA